MRGAFIVFEGIDGAGKTTVRGDVAEALRSMGREVVETAEPTQGPIGRMIRDGSAGGVSQATEAYLFCADRNDHTERIGQWVSAGKVVLCDRYFASTIAYQSSGLDGDSVDCARLLELNRPFIDRADMTILFDTDPEVGLARAEARGESISKFENLPFLRQVRGNYLRLAEEHGFRVVDASRAREEVADEVTRLVMGIL